MYTGLGSEQAGSAQISEEEWISAIRHMLRLNLTVEEILTLTGLSSEALTQVLAMHPMEKGDFYFEVGPQWGKTAGRVNRSDGPRD